MEDLYRPFSEKIRKYHKPVILSEFGSTTFGGEQSAWLANAFEKMQRDFPEIKSVVFFYSEQDPHWGFTKWRPSDSAKYIDWTFHSPQTLQVVKKYLQQPYFKHDPMKTSVAFNDHEVNQQTSGNYLRGKPGQFELMVDNRPFYIQGVVYNGGDDWRDGEIAPDSG